MSLVNQLIAAVFAVLIGLGIWQAQRLTWKQELLAEMEARIKAAPVALPVVIDRERDAYLPVKATGTITTDELHVLVSQKTVGAGYRIISAFGTGGRRVLLDRGFVKLVDKDAAREAVEATVVGNLHWPQEVDSYTPEPDEAAGIWFARDVDAMAEALGTEPVMIIVRSTSDAAQDVAPLPIDGAGIPNDHLQYAITWFSLAAVWALMTIFFFRRTRQTREGDKT